MPFQGVHLRFAGWILLLGNRMLSSMARSSQIGAARSGWTFLILSTQVSQQATFQFPS